MQNRASIKQNIIVTVLAMCISALSLISSTFAWYSLTTQASTEVIDLSVGSSMSLQISTDEDGEYKYTLGVSDMSAYLDKLIRKDAGLWVLSPVSTVSCAKFYAPTMIETSESTISSFDMIDESSGKYLELPIYLKSTRKVDVYLSDETQVIVNEPTALADQGEVDRIIRLGFVTEDGTVILEPNSAKDMPLRAPNSLGQPAEGYAISSISPLAYAEQVTKQPEQLYVRFDGSDGEEATSLNTNANEKTKIASLNAGEAKKVSIYLWIEGTDWDCINELLESTLKVDLKLIGVISE